MEQLALGNESRSPDGLTPKQVLDKISETTHAAIERQYRLFLNEEIFTQLRKEDICFLRRGELTPAQSQWVKKYFQEQVAKLPHLLTSRSASVPRLVNKSLNFIVALKGKDAFGRQIDLAVVPAPFTTTCCTFA